MAGKYIHQLTIAELKYECDQRDLPVGGTKSDLEIRLAEYFAAREIQANTVQFWPAEPAVETGTSVNDGSKPSERGQSITEDSTLPISSSTLNPPKSPETVDPNTPHPTDPLQNTRELLHTIKQATRNSTNYPSLESRLVTLENCMARFCDDQRRIAESMRRIELGFSQPTPDRIENTHQHTHARLATEHETSYVAPRDTHDRHSNRSVHFEGMSTRYNTSPPSPPRALQQSILIPYEDLRTARYSLPEFYGTTPEDPVRFIDNSESILIQAQINRLGWTKTVEPQLKGAASTWWNTIKILDLSWDEFRVEFLEKFDNAEIQARLRADIVSVRQSPKQSLTEFIMSKNQHARRITTGLAETQLVSTIAGLTRDEYRTHIRLQRPATFGDLRRIAGVLDPAPGESPVQPKPHPTKNTQLRKPHPPNMPRPHVEKGEKQYPPNPCRYCGGPHWNSECPDRATASGNEHRDGGH